MTDNMKIGLNGERAACSVLEKKGYEILEKNYRYRKSEIDLIAKHENWLVFVEVKTRSGSFFGFPEEFVDRKKQFMIFEAAENYMYEKDWNGNVRYDIVSVMAVRGNLEVYHIEDAFY
jgi:putative endonuclease